MTMTARSRTFDANAHVAAFPLGGIGTGNVSLGARGDLRDWELFNRPNKGGVMPNTFFAIRVQAGQAAPISRVLEARRPAPHDLSHGYHPLSGAGLPRLAGSTLRGEYPFVAIDFEDPGLPVRVQLEAFTPLIPLNPDDSGLPCAVLTYTLTNTSVETVSLTLVGSLINPVGGIGYDRYGSLQGGGVGQNVNEFRDEAGMRGLYLYSQQFAANDLHYGSLALATTHPDVTVKRAWVRAGWYDFLQDFWDDFSSDGRLDDLGYETPSELGKTDTGSLGLLDTLAPGEHKAYRFFLTWHFPNRTNSWANRPDAPLAHNRYAVRFGDAWHVARHLLEHGPALESQTRRFHAALHGSTLPAAVLDAVASNIVVIRSPTCFWLDDGRFFGFEGCFDHGGCCEGTCTHVWSYAQTLAYLFPSLERAMRHIEFVVETEADGYMCFRACKTFGEKYIWPWGDQRPDAASDGQMGSIIRAYREWLLSGDRDWLAEVWPGIKRALEYARREWDPDDDGVTDGNQHNTYDISFFGPNPLSGVYYLAALRAVEEMAGIMGEADLARRSHDTFARGSQRLDERLWNGEYYIQQLEDVNAHKYQFGQGCLSDQMLGQLHARLLGLGDLLPAEHVRQALKSVFVHNFKRDFRDQVNCQRTYVLNDEAGLVLCSWPAGGRPRYPFVYSDEVWTGIEYQVAAHLIYEGWVAEGLEIVRAVRDRHDGVKRSPWNEVECGHHYARSLASWAVLVALSGFHCDVARGVMRFDAVTAASGDPNTFTTFWSCGRGWGTYTQVRDAEGAAWRPTVEVLGGDMAGMRVEACGQSWTL
jgi:non-lysosomal glucosylceramidase